jgi:hypothetical protein
MRATVMHAASDVRTEDIPHAGLREPTDGSVLTRCSSASARKSR